MNKKVLKVAFVAAIALVSGINVFNAQKSEMPSNLALANVEALANCETVNHDTGKQKYNALNGCHCLSCCEPAATNCNCTY